MNAAPIIITARAFFVRASISANPTTRWGPTSHLQSGVDYGETTGLENSYPLKTRNARLVKRGQEPHQ